MRAPTPPRPESRLESRCGFSAAAQAATAAARRPDWRWFGPAGQGRTWIWAISIAYYPARSCFTSSWTPNDQILVGGCLSGGRRVSARQRFALAGRHAVGGPRRPPRTDAQISAATSARPAPRRAGCRAEPSRSLPPAARRVALSAASTQSRNELWPAAGSLAAGTGLA